MILTEHEAKVLLSSAGIAVPKGELVSPESSLPAGISLPAMLKAQVLHGNRALSGLVKRAETSEQYREQQHALFQSRDSLGAPVTQLRVEEAVAFTDQHYLSLSYSTKTRTLVAQYSAVGGEGMDERGETLVTQELSVQNQPQEFAPNPALLPLLQQLWQLFVQHDLLLLEINPLVQIDKQWVCLDAKVELDELATARHPEWSQYPERSALGRPPTQREQEAHRVSRSDHRGVAGESFFEFPGGSIGVMASGGGASTLAMDALLAEGLSPANYTEYSGNPTREKVAALTRVVLSLPKLEALFVVGSNANFTDIYETLAGVVDGLLESDYQKNPDFCVLIRRGGPRWEEAFTMVRERLSGTRYKLALFGPDFPLTQTAQELRKLLKKGVH